MNSNLIQLWAQANQMVKGKTPEQIEALTKNLAKERGVDLNSINPDQLMPIINQLRSLGLKI